MMADVDVQVRTQAGELPPVPSVTRGDPPVSRLRTVPVLVTLIALVLAGIGVWGAWQAYMAAPWTRDGAVRAYVVTIAPEVSGRIVQLPVVDNQFVHKGDLLMTVDPTDYALAVDQAQAAADQARANAENAEREAVRRANLTTLEVSSEEDLPIQGDHRGGGAARSRCQSGSCARQSGAYGDPLPSRRLRYQSPGTAWRLRDRRAELDLPHQRRLVLGGRLL